MEATAINNGRRDVDPERITMILSPPRRGRCKLGLSAGDF